MSKVSIITVTYNCKENLIITLKSIHSQTFNDWEHIVIDGDSKDGTIKIIKKHEDKISYWVSEPDNGIYDAMNKGLKAARGEYVIFLNAGDTFFENTTLAKIPFTENPGADIFYGDTMIVTGNGSQPGLRRKKLPPDLTWKHFRKGMVVCHQSILVKKSIAPVYNPDYKYTADYAWVLQSLKNSTINVFTHSVISNFMEGGFSKQKHKESLAERFKIMRIYFGLPTTLLMHLVFIIKNIFTTFGVIPKYRRIKNND